MRVEELVQYDKQVYLEYVRIVKVAKKGVPLVVTLTMRELECLNFFGAGPSVLSPSRYVWEKALAGLVPSISINNIKLVIKEK